MIDTSKLTTEELVKIYQNTENEAVLEEIINRNMGLYHVWAKQWENLKAYSYDIDDLVCEAMIKTWEMAKSFDGEKSVKFSTYLGKCVNQCYARMYKHCTRQKRGMDLVIVGGVA